MCLHVNGETTIMRSTMRELLKRLNDPVFARIHRSTVVNITQIVELTSLPKGDGMVQLANGRSLKVSRNYISALQEQILMHQSGPPGHAPNPSSLRLTGERNQPSAASYRRLFTCLAQSSAGLQNQPLGSHARPHAMYTHCVYASTARSFSPSSWSDRALAQSAIETSLIR